MISRLRRLLGAPALFLLAGGFGVCAMPADIPRLPGEFSPALGSPWTLARLDKDSRLDTAISRVEGRNAEGYLYRIDLTLSSGARVGSFIVAVDSRWGINITPRDVDGDHDLDLVITTRFSRQPVGVWINDGNGTFAEGDPDDYSDSIWLEDSSVSAGNPVDLFLSPAFEQIRQFSSLAEAGWIQPHPNPAVAGHAENDAVRHNSHISLQPSRAPPRL
jgi:hypothetical protein